MSQLHPDAAKFRDSVDERYSIWSEALSRLPHANVEQQLHLGRCFALFKELFSETRGWKLFFVKNAEKPKEQRQLSETSVDAMMSAAKLFDWADAQADREELQSIITELMERGQNYGMLDLAAIKSLPDRYWRKALSELKAVGEARRTRADYRWRDRIWRMKTLSEDVVGALANVGLPTRRIDQMLSNPKGYDRTVAEHIKNTHGDSKRISTITIRKIMEYLAEDINSAEQKVREVQRENILSEREANPELARIKSIMSLPEDERKAVIERIAKGIADIYQQDK